MTSPKTGPTTKGLHILYIPAVCLIITFQGYFSQYLFATYPDLEPGPLTRQQSLTFNLLLLILWYTYYQACTIDPGRYIFSSSSDKPDPSLRPSSSPPKRHCTKCSLPKPPRAHHCRHCNRCIPKMDHHCPWTGNCVSLQSFPYFIRFLLYTILTLLYFSHLLFLRISSIWSSRHLPSYLGPSIFSLISITLLTLSCLTTLFLLSILFFSSLKSCLFNTTMIESWEIDKHESTLSRLDSSFDNPDTHYWTEETNDKISLSQIEFPYDLGIYSNISQAMGTSNPLRWFLPIFGGAPQICNDGTQTGTGWEYEENGFNDVTGLWPPPDPEKHKRAKEGGWPAAQLRKEQEEFCYSNEQTGEDIKAAFARRQKEDIERRHRAAARMNGRDGLIAELEEEEEEEEDDQEGYEWVGKPPSRRGDWKNSDGDRLWDYGVDEEAEEDGVVDDDVPLAELIRRRKVRTTAKEDYE
ncbi:Palmitoyltransferase PFA4 [Podospora fimiseda]|uniref:Palmitoyltransferase PFA4 n=1 Tax=Podospora fimiseda TaxID=252190 RepID=A0AAN7BUP7_9PEZI|nr:Palmitoyltransferase PFA4 [Podospora fimiseda]